MASRKQERLMFEETLLKQHFGPSWYLQGVPGRLGHAAIGELISNEGTRYTIYVPLDGFPVGPPEAYVVSPRLAKRDGTPLPECSEKFHTRTTDEQGQVQVCHYEDDAWDSSVTLYKVVLKVRIWLEAYERYRATGKTPDHFLSHLFAA